MANCDICAILENKEAFKLIYEDELCFAILHENPAVAGHSLVIPKKHSPIFEELDEKSAEHLFVIANKVSTALFETMSAHGTNILVNNGIAAGQELPHVVVNVLPRKENDNLALDWQPKRATENELKTNQSMIKAYSEHIFSGNDEMPSAKLKEEHHEKKHDPEKSHEGKEEENYLIKGLKRMP